MTNKLRADLMMICGCLHDMSEQSKELYISRYLQNVEVRILNILKEDALNEFNQFTNKDITP